MNQNVDGNGVDVKKVYISITLEPIGTAARKQATIVSAQLQLAHLESAELPQLIREAVKYLQEPAHD